MNIFDIDKNSPFLDGKEAERFHRIVSKLLYVATQACTDLLLAVIFLTSRVSASREQDRAKLLRCLSFVNATINDPLILSADNLGIIHTWVDASFATHPDMKSHTGGAMSFGRGTILCKSKKQSLNTKSSTEAELVGASDYLPNMIWVQYFLQGQGIPIEKSWFYQDNESTIKLATNGRASNDTSTSIIFSLPIASSPTTFR